MHLTNEQKLKTFGKGLLGGFVMALALGLALAMAEAIEVWFRIGIFAKRCIQATLCSLIAAPGTIYIWRRIDQGTFNELGLTNVRKSLWSFGLGALLTLGPALFLFGIGWAVGWIHIAHIKWSTYFLFVFQTLPIAFLYEALPEELTLRGYSYRHLNTRLSRWHASLWTIGIFLFVPATASFVQAAAGYLLGAPHTPMLVPAGQEPVVYFVLLTFFGATLLVARISTGSLWASISVHLSFLLVNRTILENTKISGWEVSLSSENVLLLIPSYLVLSAMLFVLTARWRGTQIGWKEIEPEISS